MPKDGSIESPGDKVKIVILMDGNPVTVPAQRSSLNSIRCYLETLALEKQRVLCALQVDGYAANLDLPLIYNGAFSRVEAETVALDESFVLVLQTAGQQTRHVRNCVETALTLVLINHINIAREIWWNLARQLKEPVFTLSLLPDHLCGPANGSASLKQLRRWQLEQVAAIIREVDDACTNGGTIQISDALEHRVLPWLKDLSDLIQFWHETVAAGMRLGIKEPSL
jgi:hypothetical protein